MTTNYHDKLREQRHRQYAIELREADWIVLHESDFTVDSFHTDPYFHAVVTRIARWYEHPTDPPDPEELARLIETLKAPLGLVDPPKEAMDDENLRTWREER